MSATTPLSAVALFESHMVNCLRCKAVITKHGSIGFVGKIVDWLCPVGKKLFFEAIKEDPKKLFRPHAFPFAPKLYETVNIRVKGQYMTGRVIDKSMSAGNNPIGYEVEVSTPSRFGLPPTKTRYYVNNQNIFKASKDGKKPQGQIEVKSGSITIRLGTPVSPVPVIGSLGGLETKEGFKIKIGEI